MNYSIMLVDDHSVLRESLRHVLDEEPDMQVVAEASDGEEAVNLVQNSKANVILMDITMPNMNGIQATKMILQHNPTVKVIILSMYPEYKDVVFKTGASGFLLKSSALNEVISAIRVIAEGNYYISPEISNIDNHKRIKNKITSSKNKVELSTREREILTLTVNGKTSIDISKELFISEKTVEVHRRNIKNKLDCNNVAELVKKAILYGYVDLDEVSDSTPPLLE